jgi:hypothetical protein
MFNLPAVRRVSIFSFPRQQTSFRRNQAKHDGHEGKKGHSNVCEGQASEVGQMFCSPWFCLICRVKARAAKKPFC